MLYLSCFLLIISSLTYGDERVSTGLLGTVSRFSEGSSKCQFAKWLTSFDVIYTEVVPSYVKILTEAGNNLFVKIYKNV